MFVSNTDKIIIVTFKKKADKNGNSTSIKSSNIADKNKRQNSLRCITSSLLLTVEKYKILALPQKR